MFWWATLTRRNYLPGLPDRPTVTNKHCKSWALAELETVGQSLLLCNGLFGAATIHFYEEMVRVNRIFRTIFGD